MLLKIQRLHIVRDMFYAREILIREYNNTCIDIRTTLFYFN